MVADSAGNDISAVAVPVTGFIGFAPLGTAIPTPVQGADPDYVLPGTYRKLGLIKEDGGPQWAGTPDGDPLEFWQESYTIPTGLATVTVSATLAETSAAVREFLRGKVADENGYMTVDEGGNPDHYVIFTEEIFKSGMIRRRVAPDANINSVVEDQSTRGAVLGYATTIGINRSDLVDGDHYGEWIILPEDNS